MSSTIFLYEFHFIDVLLFVAVVAFQNALFFIDDMEHGVHGFVVGDALRIVAFHDTLDLVGRLHGFLLHHLVVAYDVENDFRCHHGKTGDLIVGEELVADFDDTFVSHFLGGVVDTDGDRGVQVEQS